MRSPQTNYTRVSIVSSVVRRLVLLCGDGVGLGVEERVVQLKQKRHNRVNPKATPRRILAPPAEGKSIFG